MKKKEMAAIATTPTTDYRMSQQFLSASHLPPIPSQSDLPPANRWQMEPSLRTTPHIPISDTANIPIPDRTMPAAIATEIFLIDITFYHCEIFIFIARSAGNTCGKTAISMRDVDCGLTDGGKKETTRMSSLGCPIDRCPLPDKTNDFLPSCSLQSHYWGFQPRIRRRPLNLR